MRTITVKGTGSVSARPDYIILSLNIEALSETYDRAMSEAAERIETIDRLVITAKDYDDFLRLMQEAGYEIKTGKYISFRAEGQERFTRSKTIGENYTEERIKERIAGRTPRRSQRQATPKGISLIGDIQERIRLIGSKGYEHKAKLTILKEAARTLNYLTENNLLQYADLEKKVEDVHSSYDRTGKELKGVEARLREVQPLIKNISNYQRLKPVYDAFQKAKDKPGFKAKHEAELVIFEAARSTLLAMQGDEKLPSLKTLQAEQQRLLEEQQRLYDERVKLKKEVKQIETMKYTIDELTAAKRQIDSTLHKLRETVKTFESKDNSERYKSQITLAKRRIKAFEIANYFIENEIKNC